MDLKAITTPYPKLRYGVFYLSDFRVEFRKVSPDLSRRVAGALSLAVQWGEMG